VSENPTSEDSARGHGFDELARAVADGSLSRRRALKLFAGTAIASLIPSRALADGRSRRRRNHHDDDDDEGRSRRRRNHHDDDDDDECFVPVCHVPFDRETGLCDSANARTLFVRRHARRRHLKNHPCDFRGRCPRSTTSSSTTSSSTTSSSTTSSSTTSSSTTSSSTTSSSTTSSSTTPPPVV
jgi:hypothetical protein